MVTEGRPVSRKSGVVCGGEGFRAGGRLGSAWCVASAAQQQETGGRSKWGALQLGQNTNTARKPCKSCLEHNAGGKAAHAHLHSDAVGQADEVVEAHGHAVDAHCAMHGSMTAWL